MSDIERIISVVDWLIYKKKVRSRRELAEKMGYTESSMSQILNGKVSLSEKFIKKLSIMDLDINVEWIRTGEGEMIKSKNHIINEPSVQYGEQNKNKKLIPFYDDVTTMGGNNGMSADISSVKQSYEYIDTGDWFRDATAAIRHYGESMTEYPSGCILAIKRVDDRRLIIPGRDYVIETSEYRVTKRIQHGHDETCFTAYSTNQEAYKDGRLIHEPFEIPWNAVLCISLVLGYVVKKNGGSIVYRKPE